ncbi:ABC transporter permease [Rhizobium rhizosphaerae]|nr:ABC-2 family transporter protein [Xaviernesmea rhizosphaerae]
MVGREDATSDSMTGNVRAPAPPGINLALYWHLMRLRARTRLQYRASLVLAWISQGFGYAGTFASIWVILNRFGGLGGWSWPEMAFLLGFHTFAYAIGAVFTFTQFRGMDAMVREGEFDMLLVRPVNPWSFIVFSGVDLQYGSHFVLGAGLMITGAAALPLAWDAGLMLRFLASLLSAALLTGAMFTIIGAFAFVLGRSRYVFGLYFDLWELSRYPIGIYTAPLQIILFTVLPFAYMSFVPVSVMIGKPVPLLGGAAPVLALAAGPILALLAALFWRACLRRHQDIGG